MTYTKHEGYVPLTNNYVLVKHDTLDVIKKFKWVIDTRIRSHPYMCDNKTDMTWEPKPMHTYVVMVKHLRNCMLAL